VGQAGPRDFPVVHWRVSSVIDTGPPDWSLIGFGQTRLAYTHTTFQQVYEGVLLVFGRFAARALRAQGQIVAVTPGTFIPDITLDPRPSLSAERRRRWPWPR